MLSVGTQTIRLAMFRFLFRQPLRRLLLLFLYLCSFGLLTFFLPLQLLVKLEAVLPEDVKLEQNAQRILLLVVDIVAFPLEVGLGNLAVVMVVARTAPTIMDTPHPVKFLRNSLQLHFVFFIVLAQLQLINPTVDLLILAVVAFDLP